MSNTSATGGYLLPVPPLVGGLSLEDFIQTVIVGVSGYTNTLVRPKYQQSPPKQPDINTNWIAFSIQGNAPDANAYVYIDEHDVTNLRRQETLTIQVGFYGPDAQNNSAVFRDGFQIQQNLESLSIASMGFKDATEPIRGPDLINERWVDRYEMTLVLVRQVRRTYEILPFASAMGVIHTVVNGDPLNIDWEV